MCMCVYVYVYVCMLIFFFFVYKDAMVLNQVLVESDSLKVLECEGLCDLLPKKSKADIEQAANEKRAGDKKIPGTYV